MRVLKNLPISKKLFYTFLFLTLLACISGICGVYSIQLIDKGYSEMEENVTEPMAILAEKSKLIQRERINLRDMILANTPEEQLIYRNRLNTIRNQMDSLSSAFSSNALKSDIQVTFEHYQQSLTRYTPISKKLESAATRNDLILAESLLRGDAFVAVKAVEESLGALIEAEQNKAHAISVQNSNVTRQTSLLISVMVVVLVLSAIGLGGVLTRLIAAPMKVLDDAAKRVIEGDLSTSVDMQRSDEIGSLAHSFNGMVQNINEALDAVNKEKAEVEQRVVQAVQGSEAQQQYLNNKVDLMLTAMGLFAEGDLTVSLPVERDDEIGRLFKGFNEAIRNIHEMICQVGHSAQAAARAANAIGSSSEQLLTSARNQSTQAIDVTQSVEQVVQTIIENSRNATITADITSENGKVAKEGGQVVEQTIQKIRQIAIVVQDSATTVERLGVSSRQIGEITQVIYEIADQTNLLALNAAIEAARAGDQGRGFAVVADEVRKLAERTSTATTEISQMIQSIQNEAEKAVSAMQRGSSEVDEGIRLADQAGEALSRVVTGANGTVDRVMQIATASEEQSATSQQIAEAVEEISSLSEQAATDILQINHSTESLNQLTAQLTQLVSSFKLDQSMVHMHQAEAL